MSDFVQYLKCTCIGKLKIRWFIRVQVLILNRIDTLPVMNNDSGCNDRSMRQTNIS